MGEAKVAGRAEELSRMDAGAVVEIEMNLPWFSQSQRRAIDWSERANYSKTLPATLTYAILHVVETVFTLSCSDLLVASAAAMENEFTTGRTYNPIEVKPITVPSAELQAAVLAAPIYMQGASLQCGAARLKAIDFEEVERQARKSGVALLNDYSHHRAQDFDVFLSLSLWDRATSRVSSIVIKGVRRLLVDGLKALRHAQNERARAVFKRQRSRTFVFKALHRPLQVIPESIRPIELAA